MATRGGITVKIDGQYDDKDIKRSIKDLEAMKTQAAGSKAPLDGMSGAFGKLAVAAAGVVSVGAVIDFMRDSMAAAMEDEKSMIALAKAMDNVGLSSQKATGEALIKSMSLQYGIADDLLRPAFQRLVTATSDVTESQKLLQLSMDISAATGKDLNSVTLAMAKAANGNIGALTRLGVPIDANIVKTKDFGAAVDILSQKFGGQAQAAADTYAGKLSRIQTAAGEAQESIGYALLTAIDDVSQSFGGTGGAVEAITKFGEGVADIVTKVGLGVTAISQLVAGIGGLVDAMGSSIGATNLWASMLSGAWQTVVTTIGGPLYMLGSAYQAGADAATSSTTAHTKYALSADRTAAALANAKSWQTAMTQAEVDAKAATDALKASIDKFNGVISLSQARDDLRLSIEGISKALDGNKKSFKGVSDAAKENRDALRTQLKDAGDIAVEWGRQTGASADEIDTKYKTMRRKIIAGFKEDGFTSADIKEFMGKEHLWRTPAKDAVAGAATAAKSTARPLFVPVGRDVATGAAAGIAQNDWMVAQAARIMMLNAAAAARLALESRSPSKVFYRIGEDITEGLKLGLQISWPKIGTQLTKDLAGLTIQVQGESVKLSGALLKGFDAHAANFKSIVDKQTEIITTARTALVDYAKSVQSTILGNVQWQTGAGADGKPLTPEQQVQMLLGDQSNQQAAINSIAKIATSIPEALVQQMLTMDPIASKALADYLAGPGSASMAQLKLNYQNLATSSLVDLGIPMANAFATVGVQNAKGMIASAKAEIANAAEHFSKWVARTLDTTITVKVRYDTSDAPGRALGGPVTASSPYIVGENGPELFVPWKTGTIVPNGDLPSAVGYGRSSSSGGNSYSIVVQAGVGDPRQIGQQIVEYVKRFEAASGPVFAAA